MPLAAATAAADSDEVDVGAPTKTQMARFIASMGYLRITATLFVVRGWVLVAIEEIICGGIDVPGILVFWKSARKQKAAETGARACRRIAGRNIQGSARAEAVYNRVFVPWGL